MSGPTIDVRALTTEALGSAANAETRHGSSKDDGENGVGGATYGFEWTPARLLSLALTREGMQSAYVRVGVSKPFISLSQQLSLLLSIQ